MNRQRFFLLDFDRDLDRIICTRVCRFGGYLIFASTGSYNDKHKEAPKHKKIIPNLKNYQ